MTHNNRGRLTVALGGAWRLYVQVNAGAIRSHPQDKVHAVLANTH